MAIIVAYIFPRMFKRRVGSGDEEAWTGGLAVAAGIVDRFSVHYRIQNIKPQEEDRYR